MLTKDQAWNDAWLVLKVPDWTQALFYSVHRDRKASGWFGSDTCSGSGLEGAGAISVQGPRVVALCWVLDPPPFFRLFTGLQLGRMAP